MPKRKRDYRKEYDEYHASPEQKKRRAERNRDRSEAEKRYGKEALKGKEVDHVGSHRTGDLSGVRTRIISKHRNRIRQPKRS